jgi:hypothetical protein
MHCFANEHSAVRVKNRDHEGCDAYRSNRFTFGMLKCRRIC